VKRLTGIVKAVSRILDKLAGLCIFSVLLLIIANIVLRTAFNRPILGTYELAGFLTAMGMALALAHCAFKDGHIAVGLIMERFPRRIQSVTAVFVNVVSLILWSAGVWSLVRFGQAMKIRGLVSPSAEIPVYPFIYFIAFGLLGLCLVLLLNSLNSIREVVAIDTAKKVTR